MAGWNQNQTNEQFNSTYNSSGHPQSSYNQTYYNPDFLVGSQEFYGSSYQQEYSSPMYPYARNQNFVPYYMPCNYYSNIRPNRVYQDNMAANQINTDNIPSTSSGVSRKQTGRNNFYRRNISHRNSNEYHNSNVQKQQPVQRNQMVDGDKKQMERKGYEEQPKSNEERKRRMMDKKRLDTRMSRRDEGARKEIVTDVKETGGRKGKNRNSREWCVSEEVAQRQVMAATNSAITSQENNWKRRNDSKKDNWVVGEKGQDQREILTSLLKSHQLECLVCYSKLRHNSKVWTCEQCYHILHLDCTMKWAKNSGVKLLENSSTDNQSSNMDNQSSNRDNESSNRQQSVRHVNDLSWRCPACQQIYNHLPTTYSCFCGKTLNPSWMRGMLPHSCGETCGKKRSSCSHLCSLQCHPGPCPPCTAFTTRYCGCGKTDKIMQCKSTVDIICSAVCGKPLSCGRHQCEQICHQGECDPCKITTHQRCWCGKAEREGPCGSGERYQCEETCSRLLSCGVHECQNPCHPNECQPCVKDPETWKTCHCGRKPVVRSSCHEEVPSCGQQCDKNLGLCSHQCQEECHEGGCPPCTVEVSSPCYCGSNRSMTASCHQITSEVYPRCKKKCSKKRLCGRHKCNRECCRSTSAEHECINVCNRSLSCGRHRCEWLCHAGNCAPCSVLGFEEVSCDCGSKVLLPPVPCGQRLPECSSPCPRRHPCGHQPTHSCHQQAECPPCTVLVSRTCHGGHETRKAIPCYVADYSCGLKCAKPLPCGHKCIELCHVGECPTLCTQPCQSPRPDCDHACRAPCHPDQPCPRDTPCNAIVAVKCLCGHRSTSTPCHQLVKIECDDNCKLKERNLRLMIALQISNPELSFSKQKPNYSTFMKDMAQKDSSFCDMVYNKLVQLVSLSRTSSCKSRQHSFDVMRKEKRQFIREYCKHFGCESAEIDAEPKRNVLVTAYKGRCWMPTCSLLEALQSRKVPVPSMKTTNRSSSNDDSKPVILPLRPSGQAPPPVRAPPTPPPQFDYFDLTLTEPSASSSSS